jgi:lysophospholipase
MVLLHLSALALAGAAYALNGSVTDYAPRLNQPCPNVTATPLVRSFTPKTQSLNSREEEYVKTRLSTVIADEWKKWITDIGYDLNAFNNSFPIVGAALSGGGYRAAQYAAGVLSALDARNETAKAAGTGGLLQVTSYMAGLSGAPQFSFLC